MLGPLRSVGLMDLTFLTVLNVDVNINFTGISLVPGIGFVGETGRSVVCALEERRCMRNAFASTKVR